MYAHIHANIHRHSHTLIHVHHHSTQTHKHAHTAKDKLTQPPHIIKCNYPQIFSSFIQLIKSCKGQRKKDFLAFVWNSSLTKMWRGWKKQKSRPKYFLYWDTKKLWNWQPSFLCWANGAFLTVDLNNSEGGLKPSQGCKALNTLIIPSVKISKFPDCPVYFSFELCLPISLVVLDKNHPRRWNPTQIGPSHLANLEYQP